MTTRVCTFGDAVLDVVVELKQLLVPDDDVPARTSLLPGGQAANVAAWCSALGSDAAVVSKVGADAAGDLVRSLLADRHVRLLAPAPAGATGIVTSMVTPDGKRSMASDRGATADFAPRELDVDWFAGAGWLHLSGYALFDAGSWQAAIAASELARSAGAEVSLDLSSATLVASVGAGEVRRRVRAVGPSIVFANEAEHAAGPPLEVPTVVVKHGAGGASVLAGGSAERLDARATPVVLDTTGAGDAFAAGWLIGGAELALEAASRCVATRGAMPPLPQGS